MLPPVVPESKLWVQFWMKCCFWELVVEIDVLRRVLRPFGVVPVVAVGPGCFCRALF